jgi:hypothetical protein
MEDIMMLTLLEQGDINSTKGRTRVTHTRSGFSSVIKVVNTLANSKPPINGAVTPT